MINALERLMDEYNKTLGKPFDAETEEWLVTLEEAIQAIKIKRQLEEIMKPSDLETPTEYLIRKHKGV